MAKPANQRLGLYTDVRAVLDAALAAGGGSVTLPTHGDAIHWRHRAYKFRKVYAETSPLSPYDALTMPKIPKDSCVVEIKKTAPPAVFTPAEGETPLPLEVETPEAAAETDELLRHALDLSKDLDV